VRWHLFILFPLFFSQPAGAAFEFSEVGARSVALGGAFCAVSDDAGGLSQNPAGMCWAPGRRVNLSACRPFGLADLDTQELAFLQPFSRWALGLRAQRFGGDLYSEMTVGLSCGRRFLDGFSAGLSLRGLQLAISQYGCDRTWSCDLGFLGAFSSRWRWGMAILNVNDARLGAAQEGLPQILAIGFSCRPEDHLLVAADLSQDVADASADDVALGRYPVELRLGCEGHLWPPLVLRLGLQSRPIRFSVGLGLMAGPLDLDYACRSHQLLGPTHYLTIGWH
jgi:hypothetical protein